MSTTNRGVSSVEVSQASQARWYFTDEMVKNTPSRRDGITEEEETKYRLRAAEFIQEAGMLLKMPQLSIATAIVFFNRLYMFKSFTEFDRWSMAGCCLFLAGKVEETPKKLKNIIMVSHHLRNKHNKNYKKLDIESQEFWDLKERLLMNERVLLQQLGFDLTLEHPYNFVLGYARILKGTKQLAQMAWNFVNDSLRTTMCLQERPEVIACAAIDLASNLMQYDLPAATDGRPWWEALCPVPVSKDMLDRISHRLMDMYEQNNGGSSTSTSNSRDARSSAGSNSNNAGHASNGVCQPNQSRPRPPPPDRPVNPDEQAKRQRVSSPPRGPATAFSKGGVESSAAAAKINTHGNRTVLVNTSNSGVKASGSAIETVTPKETSL